MLEGGEMHAIMVALVIGLGNMGIPTHRKIDSFERASIPLRIMIMLVMAIGQFIKEITCSTQPADQDT